MPHHVRARYNKNLHPIAQIDEGWRLVLEEDLLADAQLENGYPHYGRMRPHGGPKWAEIGYKYVDASPPRGLTPEWLTGEKEHMRVHDLSNSHFVKYKYR